MGVVSNDRFGSVLNRFVVSPLPARTLMPTDVQTPFLGTPLLPLKNWIVHIRRKLLVAVSTALDMRCVILGRCVSTMKANEDATFITRCMLRLGKRSVFVCVPGSHGTKSHDSRRRRKLERSVGPVWYLRARRRRCL